MIQKVKGIVLHHIKYKETSAIVYMYTDKFGRLAYIVNNIRGRKSRFAGNLLQPLTLLEIEAYHKEKRDLQRLKEMHNHIPYRTIPFDHRKSSQALFIAEVLYKVLREEESNPDLYEYLENSLQLLDVSDKGMTNFHLLFLVQLTKYLGFFPENNYGPERTGFDMRNGKFSNGTGLHPDFFEKGSSELLNKLLGLSFGKLEQVQVNQEIRQRFLEDLMNYFRLHVQGFGTLKSLAVLHEIYSEEDEK